MPVIVSFRGYIAYSAVVGSGRLVSLDTFCSRRYGNEFRTPPPVEGRSPIISRFSRNIIPTKPPKWRGPLRQWGVQTRHMWNKDTHMDYHTSLIFCRSPLWEHLGWQHRGWSLAQIMAWRKLSPESVLTYCILIFSDALLWYFIQDTTIFIQ